MAGLHLIEGQSGRQLAREVLPAFLANQRWFGAKDQKIVRRRLANVGRARIRRRTIICSPRSRSSSPGRAAPQRYFLPLATSYDDQALTHGWPLLSFALAQVRRGAKVGALYDAMAGREFPARRVRGDPARRRAAEPGRRHPVLVDFRHGRRQGAGRTSRSSVCRSSRAILRSVIGDQVMLKTYRKLAPGAQPEIEIGRFLVEKAGFSQYPAAARRGRARRRRRRDHRSRRGVRLRTQSGRRLGVHDRVSASYAR